MTGDSHEGVSLPTKNHAIFVIRKFLRTAACPGQLQFHCGWHNVNHWADNTSLLPLAISSVLFHCDANTALTGDQYTTKTKLTPPWRFKAEANPLAEIPTIRLRRYMPTMIEDPAITLDVSGVNMANAVIRDTTGPNPVVCRLYGQMPAEGQQTPPAGLERVLHYTAILAGDLMHAARVKV
jgi:hypothetical protein